MTSKSQSVTRQSAFTLLLLTALCAGLMLQAESNPVREITTADHTDASLDTIPAVAVPDSPWSLKTHLQSLEAVGLNLADFGTSFSDTAELQVPWQHVAGGLDRVATEQGLTLYERRTPLLIMQLVTREDDPSPAVVGLLMSRPDESGLWRTFEVLPRPASSPAAEPTGSAS